MGVTTDDLLAAVEKAVGQACKLSSTGSTVLVTGASSGIGAALAPMLAERGATVGIVARRDDRLERGARTVPAARAPSRACGRRPWRSRARRAVALEAWDAFGHLDVTRATTPPSRSAARCSSLTVADLDHVMDVNFFSPVRMTMAILPRMLERGRGVIVNVSSLGGRLGIAHESAYCAAKFALCGWSESMAIDLARTPASTCSSSFPGRSTPRSGTCPTTTPRCTTGRSSPASTGGGHRQGHRRRPLRVLRPRRTSTAASGRRRTSWSARPRTSTRSWT